MALQRVFLLGILVVTCIVQCVNEDIAPTNMIAALANNFAKSEFVFIGTLKSSAMKAVSMSLPPVYLYDVIFTDVRMFRGQSNANVGDLDDHAMRYRIESMEEPVTRLGQRYASSGFRTMGDFKQGTVFYSLNSLVEADAEVTQLVMEIPSVPGAWQRQIGGGWFYPTRKQLMYPHEWFRTNNYQLRCVRTGRPALLVNNRNVKFTVMQIISDVNSVTAPYGDGKFLLDLTNTGTENVLIPALLTDNYRGNISWPDSVIVAEAENPGVYVPRGTAFKQHLEGTVLKAGESARVIIDMLTFTGSDYWKVGGTRVYLSFCIGELCQQNFFYYYAAKHELMHRDAMGRATFSPVIIPSH